ncbi:thiamine phosphate synthase [Acidiplasma aeolicum]|jgi:thiamine-phosphate pyrophosphorylase|uniref:thiamine phosphate synthase n=1 Tax=Acidiplasma aeolicum TaxID=507754 RepID=UPI003712DA58
MEIKGLYLVTPDYYNDKIFDITEKALKNGANVLQYRDKTNNYKIRMYAGNKFRKLADDYGIPFIVDDDPVLMEIINADGVHIGKDDVPFEFLKEKYRDKIIGVSTYGDIDLALKYEKLGASYVAFGSFFNTTTKKDATMCDINILKYAKNIKIPVFAIGGITLDNVDTLLRYSISGVAVVSAIYSSSDPAAATRMFIQKLKEYNKL